MLAMLTPTTCIIQLLYWIYFNPFNLDITDNISDIDSLSLTIPGTCIHEVPHADLLQYKESLGPRAVSAYLLTEQSFFWNSVSSEVPHRTTLAKRTRTPA